MPLIDNQYFFLFLLSSLINTIFGFFILHNHRERKRIHQLLNHVNQSLAEKNKAITEQAARLEEAYENMWKISQRLEKEGNKHSGDEQIQHQKFVESFYYHTHKLRGILASMMGILQLIHTEYKSENLNELVDLMDECARKFDQALREFTRQMEEDL